MADVLTVSSVPFPFSAPPSGAWQLDDEARTVIGTAAPHTDIFIDPRSVTLDAGSMLSAPTLLGIPPDGDFVFSARVSVDFTCTFDAGVLLLWIDDTHWGKLCFEFAPSAEPMVVSVVTRGVSDDANAFVVPGRSVWLRISRIDDAYAFHASSDGRTWQMIRYFAVSEASAQARIGFEAQSPTGEGCTAVFDEIRFLPDRLGDIRDGS